MTDFDRKTLNFVLRFFSFVFSVVVFFSVGLFIGGWVVCGRTDKGVKRSRLSPVQGPIKLTATPTSPLDPIFRIVGVSSST